MYNILLVVHGLFILKEPMLSKPVWQEYPLREVRSRSKALTPARSKYHRYLKGLLGHPASLLVSITDYYMCIH